jgi:three-Cys-motif partner protein
MTSQPFNASDGLPARKSQPYAKEKLHYVGHYQSIFAVGMKNSWGGRVYIDLLAGPGKCRIAASGEEFDGSPLLSAQAPFTKRVFVEADSVLAAALRQRSAADAVILEADCNASETIERIRAAMPSNALGLAFVDNLGTDVTFETLRALTRDRKIDVMIVVQIGDLTRNVLDAIEGNQGRGRFDAFFGDPSWSTLVEQLKAQNAEARTIADELVKFYEGRLRTIAYDHIAESTMVMKNSTNAAQYRLVLAGKHAKAVEFFRKIEKINPLRAALTALAVGIWCQSLPSILAWSPPRLCG